MSEVRVFNNGKVDFEAEAFQDWVAGEVLPAVRKHGVYVTDQKAMGMGLFDWKRPAILDQQFFRR